MTTIPPDKVRVCVSYSDGQYVMYTPGGRPFSPDLTEEDQWLEDYTILIDRTLFEAYGVHCAADRFWYQTMQELSNEMWHRRNDP
jgi:hypothetical protein